MQLMASVTARHRGARCPAVRRKSFRSGSAAARPPMRQLLLDFTQAPEPTFANFIHGGNAELFHALEAASRGALAERVMYVWGESGAGKTHLLYAFRESAGGDPRVLAIDDVERLGDDEQAALFNAFNDHAFDFMLVT